MQRQSLERVERVGLAVVAEHAEEEFEGWRLASGAEGAKEYQPEIRVAMTGEGFLEERRGACKTGGSEGEGGLFGDGSELGLEEVGDEGEGLVVLQLGEIVEGLADDFGFGVALASFEAEQEDSLVALHLGDGAHGIGADGKGGVGEGVDKMAQDVGAVDVGAECERTEELA